jgi:hypothetical protein
MTHTIVELAYVTDSNGNLQIAGGDEQAYEQVKPHIVAIEHNMNNGIASTLYRVDDSVDQSDVDILISSSSLNIEHGIEEGIKRGIEIQPGTPTDEEVDTLASDIKKAVGRDVTTDVPERTPSVHVWNDLPDDHIGEGGPKWSGAPEEPGADGPAAASGVNGPPTDDLKTVMKNDLPSIGQGKWVCTHPDHTAAEQNSLGEECSLGHTDDVGDNEYAMPHRQTFDPTSFL